MRGRFVSAITTGGASSMVVQRTGLAALMKCDAKYYCLPLYYLIKKLYVRRPYPILTMWWLLLQNMLILFDQKDLIIDSFSSSWIIWKLNMETLFTMKYTLVEPWKKWFNGFSPPEEWSSTIHEIQRLAHLRVSRWEVIEKFRMFNTHY